MQKIKMFLILILLVLIIGCSNNDLDKVYKNMEIGENKINGYSLDIKIIGTHENKKVRENIKINNYNNSELEIIDLDKNSSIFLSRNNTVYVKDNKTFKIQKNEIIEVKDTVLYKQPAMFMEGLNHVNKINKIVKNKENKIYEVTFDKDLINIITKDTILEAMEFKENFTGEIVVNNNKQVDSITYSIEDVIINIKYDNIGKMKPINMPK